MSSTLDPNYLSAQHPDDRSEGGSNRFTLTDYVYDREDEPPTLISADVNASAGPSTLPQPHPLAPPLSALPAGAAPSHVFEDTRPSSWGLAVTGQLGNIRGSTIAPGPSIHPQNRDGSQQPPIIYPPVAYTSPSPKMPGFSARRPLPDPISPPVSLSPGPQISPSDNMAIKRLPPIPTSPPALPTPSTSSYPIPNPSRPTLPATVSSTSIASSHPSPLLPAFQLNDKLNGSRPSLATLPSMSTGTGYKARDTELEVMPALAWEDEDRNKSVSFVGLREKDGADAGDGEKGRGSRFGGGKANTEVRWISRIFPGSVFCNLLLGTVVFELVVDLIIEANILWRFNTEVNSSTPTPSMIENKRRLPIFLIIFGLAHLWQLLLTILAIRTKNIIQIFAITIFNFAFLAWAVIQVSELRQILGDLQTSLIDDAIEAGGPAAVSKSQHLLNLPLNVLTAVIIGVVAACCLVLGYLAYRVKHEFGWDRYRFLGADLQIRAYYRRFQILECLIYFAAFFAAGFGIQFLWLVLVRTDAEYIITWVMFPVSLIFLVVGRFAAKYENRPTMIIFCLGLILGQAYFIFKLVRIWQQSTTVYLNVSKSLTVFNVLSVLCLAACFVCSVLVYRDFGKGLKGAVMSQYPRSPGVAFKRWRTGEEVDTSSAAQKRISID